MAQKTYRRHRRGGNVSETKSGNPNLPYSSPIKMGGRRRSRMHRMHRMKGGSVYPYSSESTYGSYVNGNENSQYARTFSQAGPYASVPGNLIIGAQGQNANLTNAPSANSLKLVQSAGSKRRRRHKHLMRHTKRRRGGFLGQVINQAIVPFGILGMQQNYRRNARSSKNKSRRAY